MSAICFALDTSRAYGERLARELQVPLGVHEERAFEDGEHKARPLIDVSRQETIVFHTLHGTPERSANDKLCRLLFFAGALKDAGAERVTAVVPYLCYARKDRRTKPRDPITTKYVARLFEAVGVDSVVTIDVHNLAAFENAFRMPVVNVEAIPAFVGYFGPLLRHERVAVVSPDIGGTKRAEAFRSALAEELEQEPSSGFVEKRRSAGVVSGDYFVGDVEGRTVIVLDDLIASGTTQRRAAERCRAAGAARVFAAATHGVFNGSAAENFADAVFDSVVVTDSVAPPAERVDGFRDKLVVLDSAPLLAEAILAGARRDGEGR